MHAARDDLLLLLTLSPLAIAGCSSNSDEDDDAPMSATEASGGTTSGSPSSTTTSGDVDGTLATTADATGATTAVDCAEIEPPWPYEISPLCSTYAAHASECGGGPLIIEGCPELYADYCELLLDYLEGIVGVSCREAYEELMACLNALDCRLLSGPDACSVEREAADGECM